MTSEIVYGHEQGAPTSDDYLLPVLCKLLVEGNPNKEPMFEIGAGNGSTAKYLENLGYKVTGVEISIDGVNMASGLGVNIEQGSAYHDLASKYGQFKLVYALEVIEHLYSPRLFTKSAFDLLAPGGTLIISTPFHGYWKNLLLALSGKLDAHFTALWDHGHIKFWSKKSLKLLLEQQGFINITFCYAGRPYPFPKSFFAYAQRPN